MGSVVLGEGVSMNHNLTHVYTEQIRRNVFT